MSVVRRKLVTWTVLHKDLAFPEQLWEQCQLQLEVLELFPQETFRGVSSRKMALFPEREIFMQHPPGQRC